MKKLVIYSKWKFWKRILLFFVFLPIFLIIIAIGTIYIKQHDIVQELISKLNKDFEGKIDNALEKVLALSGYYYKDNELAKELGYDNDRRQVGLSAQEVKKILPEVITEAPIDDQYLTIWYDKLIPLIIEAIKELADKK